MIFPSLNTHDDSTYCISWFLNSIQNLFTCTIFRMTFKKSLLNLQQGSLTRKPSRDGRNDGRNDKRQMSSMSQHKIIDLQIEKVELHQTENAWKPAKLNEAPSSDGQVGLFSFGLILAMLNSLKLAKLFFYNYCNGNRSVETLILI